MTPIVLRIKQLREVNGWSQAELARRSGVHQSVISRLESGRSQSVSLGNLEKLAGALECDPGYLIAKRAEAQQPAPRSRRARRSAPTSS